MGLSAVYGPADDTKSQELLREAIELGCVFWDTVSVKRPVLGT
jgi:hypothetical protein